MKVKKNTVLRCHTDLEMEYTREIEAARGNRYVVLEASENNFAITDESGDHHEFDQDDYTEWFNIELL